MNYGQNVTVHQLTAQPAGQDPVFFWPKISGGGYVALVGTLVQFAAASTATTVVQINKSAGTDMTVSGLAGGITAGMLVHNNTSGSYAFIQSVSAGVATMCQPFSDAQTTTPSLFAPAIPTAWATSDSMTVYNIPPSCNLKAWRAEGGDVLGSAASICWANFIQVADIGGHTSDFFILNDNAQTTFSACYFGPRVSVGCFNGRNYDTMLLGCFFASNLTTSGTLGLFGGCIQGNWTNLGVQLGATDCNLIVMGTVGLYELTTIGSVHFAGVTVTMDSNALLRIQNITTGAGPFVWGAASLVLLPGAVYFNQSGTTFAASLLLNGALKLGAATTGSKYAAGVWTDGITITAANLDTNNGLQDPATGARFCNIN